MQPRRRRAKGAAGRELKKMSNQESAVDAARNFCKVVFLYVKALPCFWTDPATEFIFHYNPRMIL